MANTGFISMAPAVAAVAAQITAMDAVVDAIRAVDVPALSAENVAIEVIVDLIRATDFPTTDALINGIDVLSAKQKSLLGVGVCPGFHEFFNTVANGANPDATFWNVIENTGTVVVESHHVDVPGYLLCTSGAVNNEDGIAHTKDKFVISFKNRVTSILLEAYCKMDWTASSNPCGIGLIENDSVVGAGIPDMRNAAENPAAIIVNGGVPTAYTSDGAVVQTTDLSAFITDDTWFLFEMEITAGSVTFTIDGTLRATHITRVTDTIFQIMMGSTCCDAANALTYCDKVEVWGE